MQSRVDRLDVSLFDTIESQTTEDDRRSLLALQSAYRQWKGRYTLLEIGSYQAATHVVGRGSLQAFIADPGTIRTCRTSVARRRD